MLVVVFVEMGKGDEKGGEGEKDWTENREDKTMVGGEKKRRKRGRITMEKRGRTGKCVRRKKREKTGGINVMCT